MLEYCKEKELMNMTDNEIKEALKSEMSVTNEAERERILSACDVQQRSGINPTLIIIVMFTIIIVCIAYIIIEYKICSIDELINLLKLKGER